MTTKRKKYLKYIVSIVLSIPVAILVYLLFALVLSIIPVNTTFVEPKEGVDIYIESNGVHTDIVVPVKSPAIDWTSKVDTQFFNPARSEFKYIAFGWGDKGFYLDTPTWADLKFSTAFKALFWLGTSAMHVSYSEYVPIPDKDTRKIRISKVQYEKLIRFIDESFQIDGSGKYIPINCCHYKGMNDNFFEAKGKYNLFRTCNTWTNKGLKTAEVKTAFWAPFEWSVMYHRE
jgi:uncharacterized protein (TIGR02117 family)